MSATLTDADRAEVRRIVAEEQPRVVRLDDLSPEQRRLVVALVDAARSSAEKMIAPDVSETPSGTIESEVGHDRPDPTR